MDLSKYTLRIEATSIVADRITTREGEPNTITLVTVPELCNHLTKVERLELCQICLDAIKEETR